MLPTEGAILSGYLIIPQQSGFSLKGISKKKSSNVKYCLLYKASNHGIQRLEICDKTDHRNQNIITLENCVKITQEQAPANLIHIVTKSETITLNTLNEDDLHEWVTQLQSVAFKDKADQSAGGACSASSGTSAAATAKHSPAIEEDNDLYYYTTHPEGIFTVRLRHIETTTTKVHLEKKLYLLQLAATELQLRGIDEQSANNNNNNNNNNNSRTDYINNNNSNNINEIVVTWPYRFIRKYGYRDNKFTFEAGRKCDTGEGNFSLEHDKPQDIFRCMASKMKSMRKLISGDSLASLDCGEHQLSAALSMEAGSRNPLPPSPGSGSSSHQIHNHSSHSLHGFLSSNDSLNNMSMSSGPLSSMLSSLTSTNLSTTSSTVPFLGNGNNGNITNTNTTTTATTTTTTNKSSHHQIIPNKPPRKSLMNNNSNINDEPNSSNNNNKFNKFSNYEPIATVSATKLKSPNGIDANKTLLNELTNKTNSTHTNDNEENPPELPIRNESKICPDDKYEYVELKTEAWKTLGINEVKHIEAVTPDDDFKEFAWQRAAQSNKDSALDPRDKLYHAKFIDINDSVGVGVGAVSGADGNHSNGIDYCDNNNNNNNNNIDKKQTDNNEFDIDENYTDQNGDRVDEDDHAANGDDDDDDGDTSFNNNDPNSDNNFSDHKHRKTLNGYDKLDFFGSRGKPSNDYKTIVTIQSPGYKKQTSQPVTSNDYEIIGSPDTQPCRMADDSFLGYGMLRKTANSQILLPTTSTTTTTTTTNQQPQPQQQHHKYTSIVPSSIGLTTPSAAMAIPTSSNTLSIHSSNNINSAGASGITTNNIVTHQKINGLDYAYVVSKPKRV